MRDTTRRNDSAFDDDRGRSSAAGTDSGRFWIGLSFVLVLVLTSVAFAATEQGYVAYQHSGAVEATVTSASVVDGADGPSVELRVAVRNPTAVPIRIDAPASVNGRIGDRIVARAHADAFTDVSVRAGRERIIAVPMRIHHRTSTATVAAALENGTFDLSGRLRGTVRDRSIFVDIERGEQ